MAVTDTSNDDDDDIFMTVYASKYARRGRDGDGGNAQGDAGVIKINLPSSSSSLLDSDIFFQ